MLLRGQEVQRMKVGTLRTHSEILLLLFLSCGYFLTICPSAFEMQKSHALKKGKEKSHHCHLASTETHMPHSSECSLRERKKKIASYKSATLRGFFVQLPSFSCLNLLTGTSIYNVALSHPIS